MRASRRRRQLAPRTSRWRPSRRPDSPAYPISGSPLKFVRAAARDRVRADAEQRDHPRDSDDPEPASLRHTNLPGRRSRRAASAAVSTTYAGRSRSVSRPRRAGARCGASIASIRGALVRPSRRATARFSLTRNSVGTISTRNAPPAPDLRRRRHASHEAGGAPSARDGRAGSPSVAPGRSVRTRRTRARAGLRSRSALLGKRSVRVPCLMPGKQGAKLGPPLDCSPMGDWYTMGLALGLGVGARDAPRRALGGTPLGRVSAVVLGAAGGRLSPASSGRGLGGARRRPMGGARRRRRRGGRRRRRAAPRRHARGLALIVGGRRCLASPALASSPPPATSSVSRCRWLAVRRHRTQPDRYAGCAPCRQ